MRGHIPAFIAAAAACAPTALAQATFTGVGVPQGFDWSVAAGVSDNGQTVVGTFHSIGGNTPSAGFRWSAGTAVQLPLLAGYVGSSAAGISGDGTTIVGTLAIAAFDPNSYGVVWTGGAPTQLPGPQARPGAANANGSIIVGLSYDANADQHATRWQGGVRTLIGTQVQSYAGVINAAGDVIGGQVDDPAGGRRAFISGPGGYQQLPNPTGGFAHFVTGINSAGTRLVGTGGFGTSVTSSFLWSVDGAPTVQVLPNPFGPGTSMTGNGITDADIVLGSILDVDRNPTGAYLWTSGGGAIRLEPVMIGLGANLTGWTGLSVTDVTPDGRTIVGVGRHEISPGVTQTEGWVFSSPVAIPTPPATLLGMPLVCFPRRKRRA